jgi:C4-type Zn-finger protein
MKGYTEFRGQASRLAFDPDTNQFVEQPIAHGFTSTGVVKRAAEQLQHIKRVRAAQKKTRKLKDLLERMEPGARDDVGMTHIYANIPNV